MEILGERVGILGMKFNFILLLFSCSIVSDSAIPWTAAHQASVLHYLPEFVKTHVH